ncbi:DUF1521 domain-containing protein [Caballeronia sp. KNU42]
MQASTQSNYPQINTPYLSFQGSTNTLFGGGAQSLLSRGAETASQMSNMLSGFSKASFPSFGQSCTPASSNPCRDNSKADNRAPPPPSRNDCGSKDAGKNNPTPSRNDCGGKDSGKNNPTPSRNDCGGKDAGKNNPTPSRNDCGGKDSGKNNPTPSRNDCGGKDAGKNNPTPPRNDCGGKDAGKNNPTPSRNDCGGKDAGKNNPTPSRNDCGGKDAGKNNPTPSRNDCSSKDPCKNNSTPSRNDCGGKDAGKNNSTEWTNTAVCNNKTSINLGNYTLDFNKADSSMVMTNTKSGDITKIWGDPHITQHENAANSSTAMFNGPMTFMLPDNTKVTVSTQAAANNKNISFADQVTITHGKQAYQVTGLSEQDAAGLNVQKSKNGRALDAATPDGYTVLAARNGSGWIDPVTGKEPTAANISKANT